MGQVNLTINGHVYRMACGDGEEEHVLELGRRYVEAINLLRGEVGEVGDQRLMVMAGILMTDRLDDAERRLKRAEQDVRELKESRLDSASRIESLGDSFAGVLDEAAERIEHLAERLRGTPDIEDQQE